MENNNTILNELKEISAVVAAIGQQQPYAVPDGYFDSLPLQVMLRIGLEGKTGADPVVNINKDNVYQAPAGYFDALAGNILNRVKAEDADAHLEEPDLSSTLWQQLGKKNPFTVPEGYFNDFSDNIVAGAKAIEFVNGELENLSPLMTSLKTKQVYEVPAGYFNGNVEAILKKVNEPAAAKVISIGFGRKMMRYAAAAVIAGVVITAGYLYSGKTGPVIPGGNSTVSELAKVSDQEIENFLNINTASVADTSNIITTDEEITEKDSKDLLANISDEELQHYAEQQHLETPITN